MWNTTFKHSESGVEEITHDFGSKVTVVTNFKTGTTCRKHGDIIVGEWPVENDTEKYTLLLESIDLEINPIKNEAT